MQGNISKHLNYIWQLVSYFLEKIMEKETCKVTFLNTSHNWCRTFRNQETPELHLEIGVVL